MGGLVYFIMYTITSSLFPSSYNPVASFSFAVGSSIPIGILFGIIVFLLVSRAEMNRTLRKYLLVSLVFQGVLVIIDLILLTTEFNLIVNGSIKLIINLADAIVYALVFFYLEQRVG